MQKKRIILPELNQQFIQRRTFLEDTDTLERGFSRRNSMMERSTSNNDTHMASQFTGLQSELEYQHTGTMIQQQPLPQRNLEFVAWSPVHGRTPMEPKQVLPKNEFTPRVEWDWMRGPLLPPRRPTKAPVQTPTLKENDTWHMAASTFHQQHRDPNSLMTESSNRHLPESRTVSYLPFQQTSGHLAVPDALPHVMHTRSTNADGGGHERIRRTKGDTLERGISERNSMMQHSVSTSDIPAASEVAESQWRSRYQAQIEKTRMEKDKANSIPEIDREKVSAGGDSIKKGGHVRRRPVKTKARLKAESLHEVEGGKATRMEVIEKLLLTIVENQGKQAAELKQTVEEWKELIKLDVMEILTEMKEEQAHERLKLMDEWEEIKKERKEFEEWRKSWEKQGKDLEDKTDDGENCRKQAIVVNGLEDQKGETWMMMMMTKMKVVNDFLEEKLKNNILKLLAEHKVSSYDKAEIAAKLLQLKFDESEAVEAACECSTVELAIRYLQQKCEVCFELYPMSKMVAMLNCDHRCCRICAKEYFKTQIRNCNVVDIQCPVCNPLNSIDDEEMFNEYFARLDILLRDVVSAEVHALFQQKLRDWTIEKLGNFKWCAQCKNGYAINDQNEKTLTCPHCNFMICALCECKWEKQHNGISCEQYAKWKKDNDPEFQAEECPKCNFQYSLAKGGCMHFNCLQCKFGFCSGCGQPFLIGGKCNVSIYCENYGLHAHHPRNCLFYLRDKDPVALQKILDDACVPYDKESSQNEKCLVNVQLETLNGLSDGHCGKKVGELYAGLCRLHYVEYLVDMINRNSIDPIGTFDKYELALELKRHNKEVPRMGPLETDVAYCLRLRQIIMEEIPLEDVCSPTQA